MTSVVSEAKDVVLGPLQIRELLGIELSARQISECGPRPEDVPAIMCPQLSLGEIARLCPDQIRLTEWSTKFSPQTMAPGWMQIDWEKRIIGGTHLNGMLETELEEDFSIPHAVEAVWMALLLPDTITKYLPVSLLTRDTDGKSVVLVQPQMMAFRTYQLTLSLQGRWGGSLSTNTTLVPVKRVQKAA